MSIFSWISGNLEIILSPFYLYGLWIVSSNEKGIPLFLVDLCKWSGAWCQLVIDGVNVWIFFALLNNMKTDHKLSGKIKIKGVTPQTPKGLKHEKNISKYL